MSEQYTKEEAAKLATLEWWTTKEAAAHWRMSQRTIERECEEGKIPAQKFRSMWRIHVSVIHAKRDAAKVEQSPMPRYVKAKLPPVPDRIAARRARMEAGSH